MRILVTALLTILVILPAPAAARTALSLATGFLVFDETHSGGALFGGIRGSYRFGGTKRNDSLTLEGALLYAQAPAVWTARVDGLYPVALTLDWKGHLALGLGALGDEDDTIPVLAFGGVITWQPNTPFLLRMDGRYLKGMWGDGGNGVELGIGAGYAFGYQKKPKPAPPPDGDKDGVKDSSDRCPDTPAGMDVDKQGCPIDAPDTDGDRVPDYKDKCQETTRGVAVDATGCPPDDDRDGVPNTADDCPETPSGLRVGADGCVEIRK